MDLEAFDKLLLLIGLKYGLVQIYKRKGKLVMRIAPPQNLSPYVFPEIQPENHLKTLQQHIEVIRKAHGNPQALKEYWAKKRKELEERKDVILTEEQRQKLLERLESLYRFFSLAEKFSNKLPDTLEIPLNSLLSDLKVSKGVKKEVILRE